MSKYVLKEGKMVKLNESSSNKIIFQKYLDTNQKARENFIKEAIGCGFKLNTERSYNFFVPISSGKIYGLSKVWIDDECDVAFDADSMRINKISEIKKTLDILSDFQKLVTKTLSDGAKFIKDNMTY